MEKIDEIWMPNVYKAVGAAFDQGYTGSKTNGYQCNCCGKTFSATYKWQGYMAGGWGDNYLFCPGCGTKLVNDYRHNDIYYSSKALSVASENLPISLGLRLYRMKNGYRLDISADTITLFSSNRSSSSRIREYITFDVKKRKTTCRSSIKPDEVLELGSPFDRRFQEDSLLRFINRDIMRHKDWAKKVRAIMRALRDGLRASFKRVHGYDIGSLFISSGIDLKGKLLAPVSYIATRLVLPDLKHMEKRLFQQDNYRLVHDTNDLGLGGELPGDTYHNGLFKNLEVLRKAPDSITGLMQVANIPNKPLYRKAVMDRPHYANMLGILAKWFAPDMAVKLLEHFARGYFDFGMQGNGVQTLSKLLDSWNNRYDLNDIYKTLMGTRYIGCLLDIENMQKKLDKHNAEKFKTVKLSKAHDWLVEAIREQRERDYNLNIPESIRRRLEMQEGQLKFFMPDTHWKLRDYGKEFHNCVETYAQRVLEGRCGIVIMTDDKGLLAACLEVKDKELVQAKLKYNKPVYENEEINKAVLKWCKNAGLIVCTKDVQKATKRSSAAISA